MASGTNAGACSAGKPPDRSITAQPAAWARGAKLRVTEGPAAKKASLTLLKSKLSTSRTRRLLLRNITPLPADSLLASRCRVPTGKSCSSRICTRVSPTVPVAPITAISIGWLMGKSSAGTAGAALYTTIAGQARSHRFSRLTANKKARAVSSTGFRSNQRQINAPAKSAACGAAARPHPTAAGRQR
ncbi:hypothetical protein D3C75_1004930 [compost metagenome]